MAAVIEQQPAVPELQARAMLVSDLPGVVRIEQDAYAFPWTEGIFRDCLRVGYTCRVIEVGGALAGYGILSAAAGEAHLLNLCVTGPYRARGLGRYLLRELMRSAHDQGAREMFLEVRPSNVAAVRLYERSGFAQIGVRRGYYQALSGREDAVVLRRSLETITADGAARDGA